MRCLSIISVLTTIDGDWDGLTVEKQRLKCALNTIKYFNCMTLHSDSLFCQKTVDL